MKFVKTRLRNRLSDINLARLMRIVIEGPELTSVHLMKFWMYVYKEQNCRIALYIVSIITCQSVTDILCTSVSIRLLRSLSAAVNV